MNAKTEIEVLKATLYERDLRYTERFASQEKAILKAEVANEKRFESVNEFRKTLTDQAVSFATRESYENLRADITRLENLGAANAGRGAGMLQLWALIGGATMLLISIVVFIFSFGNTIHP